MDLLLLVLVLILALAIVGVSGGKLVEIAEEVMAATGLGEVSAGFVILSVSTSLPELSVAVFSILEGDAGISVGDILGSNVTNIALVGGICALLGMRTSSKDLTEIADLLFFSSLVPLLLFVSGEFSRLTGLALLGLFVYFVHRSLKVRIPASEDQVSGSKRVVNWGRLVAKLLLTAASLAVGARLTVWSVSNLSEVLGVATMVIGAKVVSLGTSLPELMVDVTAVRRGRTRLALGDVLGSNLTNISLILGLVLVSAPHQANPLILAAILPYMIATSLMVFYFLAKGGIDQNGAIVLILTYALFQATI